MVHVIHLFEFNSVRKKKFPQTPNIRQMFKAKPFSRYLMKSSQCKFVSSSTRNWIERNKFSFFFFSILVFSFSPISKEQRAVENAMVMFSVKDRDLFGISNQYIADCFITFAEIEGIDRMEQKHLTLNRPTTTGFLFVPWNLENFRLPNF